MRLQVRPGGNPATAEAGRRPSCRDSSAVARAVAPCAGCSASGRRLPGKVNARRPWQHHTGEHGLRLGSRACDRSLLHRAVPAACIAADIRGRVLEIGDASYSEQFRRRRGDSAGRPARRAGHPAQRSSATSARRSACPPQPSTASSSPRRCIWSMTSTLLFEQLHQSLAPGGVLLLTVPGISQIDRHEWRDDWYWAMTPTGRQAAAGRRVRHRMTCLVESHGNVFAATMFLQGLALTRCRPGNSMCETTHTRGRRSTGRPCSAAS